MMEDHASFRSRKFPIAWTRGRTKERREYKVKSSAEQDAMCVENYGEDSTPSVQKML